MIAVRASFPNRVISRFGNIPLTLRSPDLTNVLLFFFGNISKQTSLKATASKITENYNSKPNCVQVASSGRRNAEKSLRKFFDNGSRVACLKMANIREM